MDVATGAFRRLLVVSTTPGLNPKVGETAQPSEAVAIERSREALFADPELWAARQQETQGDFGRRSLNMVVAVIGIVLTAPLMVLIGTAIKLTSRGPVIFRQHRIGIDRRTHDQARSVERRDEDRGGRVFTMYKFRTMYHRKGEFQVWTRPDDPRITPVGRVLRRSRLDELPQLFNVLKGDMNVVGPRPEQPRIFQRLANRFGAYRNRQRVLPGITGMAQVQLPPDQNLEDVRRKVDMDLAYIQKKSFWTDVKIMFSTVRVLLFPRRPKQ